MSGHRQVIDKRERVEPPPRPQIPFIVWIMLAFLLGALLMYLRMTNLYLDAAEVVRSSESLQVRARDDPREGSFGVSGEVTVIDASSSYRGKRIELRYGRDTEPLQLGQVATVSGIIEGLPLEGKQAFRFKKGVFATLNVQALEHRHYQNTLTGILWKQRDAMQSRLQERSLARAERTASPQSNQDAFGLVSGLTYGDRRWLSGSILESALQHTGLAHYLAVSGTHMALLAGLAFLVLSRTPLSKPVVSAITLSLCISFVFFTGFAAGSIRSVIMLAVALLAYVLSRRVCVMSSLACAGLGMLMIEPLLAVSLGFLLSFASVAAIVLFARYVQQWITLAVPLRLRYRARPACNALAIALVASLSTLPLTLDAFGILPLIGPLANLLVAPVLGLLLSLSFVAHFFSIIVPPLGALLLDLCLSLADVIATIITFLARIPWSSLPASGFSAFSIALFVFSIVGLWFWWPRPSTKLALRFAGILASVLIIVAASHTLASRGHQLGPHARSDKLVTILDVGQGDALIIREGSHVVLVDTGPSPQVLREQLLSHKVRRIDTLVLSHDHADHAEGAKALSASYGIKQIVVAAGSESSPVYQELAQRLGAPLRGALAGDKIILDWIELRFIWPQAPVRDPSANESCLIKLIVDTEPAETDSNPIDIVLSSGDAEAPELRRALNSPAADEALSIQGRQQEVDVLKVPHHGSKNSLDQSLSQELSRGAGIAIISSGADNSYGHPRPEPLELIERYFQKLYRTDMVGSVTIEL
ncbi:MAG: DNA internalization-related competence protein ComEC/Rec2 [Coriobacteriia bacterium]|nr:DNA internalization-related competence protein ComEC/Rec2 [Coriobacteriia bacterium]MCL2536972.1 DNA internalization-related competence protein ComEC/Rec2 [Coriobacteriia bacterium]